MTRFIKIIAIVSVFSAFSAIADDTSSGCGLGYEVSKTNSLLSSAIRNTTNTVLPHSFSMTFGTSGCQKHSIVRNEKAPIYFIEANREVLALESAQGEGEYLRGLAAVMGCDANFSKFSNVIQSHYSTLFPTDGSASQLLMNVESLNCGATI